MSAPLDELYFRWLYEQVADPSSSPTYWNVLKELFQTEFVWFVPNDENRIEDGKALRMRFLRETGEEADQNWIEIGCSVLELMVGLSERLAFLADGEPHYWFWELMVNISLQDYHDGKRYPQQKVEENIKTAVFREYNPNGLGGFFPLRNPKEDQRRLELWQQLNEYILEMENN